MPPSVDNRLRNVLEAIIGIDEILAGICFDQFGDEKVLRLATERDLEIVCEADRNFPDTLKQSASGIDWRKMNDFANLLRHAYHSTNVDIVWDITQNYLPSLKSFVELQIRMSSQ